MTGCILGRMITEIKYHSHCIISKVQDLALLLLILVAGSRTCVTFLHSKALLLLTCFLCFTLWKGISLKPTLRVGNVMLRLPEHANIFMRVSASLFTRDVDVKFPFHVVSSREQMSLHHKNLVGSRRNTHEKAGISLRVQPPGIPPS